MLEKPKILRQKYDKPKLMLYTPSKKMITPVNLAFGIKKVMKRNESWELSFKVPKKEYCEWDKYREEPFVFEGREFTNGCINQDSCQMLVNIAGEDDYYIIKEVVVNSSDKTILEVNCYREEESLKNIFCEVLKLVGQTPEQLWNAIKSSCKIANLNYFWDGTDADTTKLRSIVTTDEVSVWDNMLTLASLYDGWWEITTDENTKDRHLFLRTKPLKGGVYWVRNGLNYKNLDINFSTQNIITRVYGYGAKSNLTDREINIMDVNPTGMSYIEDFSFFKEVLKMTDEDIAKDVNCHQEATFRDSNMTDQTDLYNATLAELHKKNRPEITGSITYDDIYVFDYGYEDGVMDMEVGYELEVMNTDIDYIFTTIIDEVTKNYDEDIINTPLGITNITPYTNPLKDIVNSVQTVSRITDKTTDGSPYISTVTVKDETGETAKTKFKKVNATLEVHEDKIDAVVEADGTGMSWQLNQKAFVVACVGASDKNVTIDNEGLTVNNGKFKLNNNNHTVFYVNLNGQCTADGGFLVKDGNTSCKIDSTGILLKGENGHLAKIEILDDETYSGTYVRDDLYVEDVLRVFGKARFEQDLSMVNGGTIYVEDGKTLAEYIDERIRDFCISQDWALK